MQFGLIINLFLFFLGTAIGSFLNVVIYRTIHDESWVKGRSKCDVCGQKIAWYDNMPIVSFILLRGKSRCCRQPLQAYYPAVEFMTGSLFVWWYWASSFFFKLTSEPLTVLQPLFWLLVGILLILIFFADLKYLIIPNLAVYSLFLLTIAYRLYLVTAGVMQSQDLRLTIGGLVLAVALIGGLWLLTRGRGMGLGDVKLSAPMALLLGWPRILVGLFLAFIIGGLVATGLLVTGKKKLDQKVPFGPFMVLGTVLSLVWGELIFNWYLHWLW